MKSSTTGLSLASDAAIDLHLHTTYSDGHWAPEALLDHLLHEQFGLAAITDHDRADTMAAIQQLAFDKHLPVLVGAEMTTTWKGELTDLLCYGFDAEHHDLNDLAQDLLERQQENSREVYENLLRRGYGLSEEALRGILAQPGSQQPHTWVALLEDHYGLGGIEAWEILSAAGCAFATNEPAAVVEAAQRSGAVCLLAHPGRKDGFVTFDAQLLDQFRQEAAIDGLEVYHPSHTTTQAELYGAYARRHHLLISAGSDSHKPERPPIKYRAELCRDLLERLGIQIE